MNELKRKIYSIEELKLLVLFLSHKQHFSFIDVTIRDLLKSMRQSVTVR